MRPALMLICLFIYLVINISVAAYCQVGGGNTGTGENNKIKIGGGINSDNYNELAPSITADGKTMVFISDKTGILKLYLSTVADDGNWTTPKSIDQINYADDSTEQIDGVSVSYDGNSIFYSANGKKSNGNNDIFTSIREGSNWSKPAGVGPKINTSEYEGSPSISSDGQTLYFTRVKKDFKDKELNETCCVIYRCLKQMDGSWSAPETLPYPLNFQCDKSPRILADNKTMIFSSYRPGGQGGYDIYQSREDENNEWSTPVPLNFVNTPQSDSYAAVPASGDRLYFSANGDIWSVSIPENLRQNNSLLLDGTVMDGSTKSFLQADISVFNALTAEPVFNATNDMGDGKFSLVLTAGNFYNVEFSKQGYSTATFSYDLRTLSHSNQLNQNISLFNSVQIRINVDDSELYIAVPAKVITINETTGNQVSEFINDIHNPGNLINLQIGSRYKINIGLPDYGSKSLTYSLDKPVIFHDVESRVNLAPLKLKVPINVTDYYNGHNLEGKVILKNLMNSEILAISANEMVSLRKGNRYRMEIITDYGYFFTYAELVVSENDIKVEEAENPELISVADNSIDVKLIPVVPNSVINLTKVNFESLTAKLTRESYEQLDMIIQVMRANPTLRIEIADNYANGTLSLSKELAGMRARSISEYLVTGNISWKRIVQKGIGNIGNLNSEDDKNANKAEIKVLEVLK